MLLTPVPENLTVATQALDAFLDSTACASKTRIALETVLEEAFMNIVLYAGATVVELSFQTDGADIILQLSDDGMPFDPLRQAAPDVTLPAEARPIGGLGILMLRRMTDRQTYVREGGRNILTLWKRED